MFGEPLDQYFGVGARLIYMRHAQEKLPIHGQGYTKSVVELFLQDLARFPMPVTRQASQPLRDFLKKIEGRGPRSVLTADEAKDLKKIAFDITPTFEAESKCIMTASWNQPVSQQTTCRAKMKSAVVAGR